MIYNVIGMNYGDEGKGKVVNYLAKSLNNDCVVVKTNGGSQAGHTVVEDGKTIINHQFGSAVFCSTILSGDFLFNPVEFLYERDIRKSLNFNTSMYANIMCSITTVLDVMDNQTCSLTKSHGSVGHGIFSTIKRSRHIPLKLYHFFDCYYSKDNLVKRLKEIARYYSHTDVDKFVEFMINSFNEIFKFDDFNPLDKYYHEENIIFENGQGLLLSQANWNDMPNLTPSFTGIENVEDEIVKMPFTQFFQKVKNCYVTRTYITRHGNGNFEEENKSLKYEDKTNVYNEYQGYLRFGYLNVENFTNRLKDLPTGDLFVNHFDQYQNDKLLEESLKICDNVYVSGEKESNFNKYYEN